jgi:hypothetical protein
MRRSSKTALAVCAVLAAYLLAVYIPISRLSHPDFTESDGRQFLTEMEQAFRAENASRVTSYAWEDAVVAGQTLSDIRRMLQRAFAYLRNGEFNLTMLRFSREGDRAKIVLRAHVEDKTMGVSSEQIYNHPVQFELERRSVPQMLGLTSIEQWKIVAVDAPNIPKPSDLAGGPF